jgi:type II secretory pathway pseudopilin PulG
MLLVWALEHPSTGGAAFTNPLARDLLGILPIEVTAVNVTGTPRNQGGFTLTEAVIALLLVGLTVGGMLTSFLVGRVSAFHTRYHTQVMNLMQAKIEELTAGSYDNVQDQGPTDVTIDPGKDLKWGTDDDLIGTLRVVVADSMDLDGDGNTDEEEIDLDGDGINDHCKPICVSLRWRCHSLGGDPWLTSSLDTLIAKR